MATRRTATLVFREPKFEKFPKCDTPIMEAVSDALRGQGWSVATVEAQDFTAGTAEEIVCTMARGEKALKALEKVQQSGVAVVNTPRAVRDCQERELTYLRLREAGLHVPRFEYMDVSELKDAAFEDERVLKPVHGHGRVQVVGDEESTAKAFAAFHAAGEQRVMVQKHLDGVQAKFYVAGERVWLTGEDIPEHLQADVSQAAAACGPATSLQVYSGDIVLKQNIPYVVDVNDFPSFSPVREEAGPAIARVLVEAFERNKNRRR